MTESNSKPPGFEETYPKYEFSELVRLSIGLAALWRGLGIERRRRASDKELAGRRARHPRPPFWPRFGKQIF